MMNSFQRLLSLVALASVTCGLVGCADTEPTPAESETSTAALEAPVDAKIDLDEVRATAKTDVATAAINACERGAADACFELADLLHGGDGVARDNELSIQLFNHACHSGEARACHEMAARLQVGIVVDADLHDSRAYYQQACQAGWGPSCHMLAKFARDGLGVPIDPDLAQAYRERSCALGMPFDCEAVAGPLQRRLGRHEWELPADASDDVVRHARACDSGLMTGCVALARAYDGGQSIPANAERALELYGIACDWGALEACQIWRTRRQ